MCSPRARLSLVRRSAAGLSVTAPVIAEALGAIDIDGMSDIAGALGAIDGAVVAGACVAAPPAQAAKVTAAAAVRMMGRNFTCGLLSLGASPRPRDHRPSSRGGLGH